MKILKRFLAIFLALVIFVNVCIPRKSEAIVPAVLSSKVIIGTLAGAGIIFSFNELMTSTEIDEVLTSIAISIYQNLSATAKEFIDSLTGMDSVDVPPEIMNSIIDSAVSVVNHMYVDSSVKLVKVSPTTEGYPDINIPYHVVDLPFEANTYNHSSSDIYDIDGLMCPFFLYDSSSSSSTFNVDGITFDLLSETVGCEYTNNSYFWYKSPVFETYGIKYLHPEWGSFSNFGDNLICGSLTSSSVKGIYFGNAYNSVGHEILFLSGSSDYVGHVFDSLSETIECFFIWNSYSDSFGTVANVRSKTDDSIIYQAISIGDTTDTLTTLYGISSHETPVVTIPEVIPEYTGTATIPIEETLTEQLTVDVVGETAGTVDTPDTPSTGTTEVSLLESILNAILGIPNTILEGIKSLFSVDSELYQQISNLLNEKLPIIDQSRSLVDNTIEIFSNNVLEPPQIIIDFSDSDSEIDYGGEAVALDFSWYQPYKGTVDLIIIGFVYIIFFWRLFYRLPSIVAGSDSIFSMFTSDTSSLSDRKGGKVK